MTGICNTLLAIGAIVINLDVSVHMVKSQIYMKCNNFTVLMCAFPSCLFIDGYDLKT